MTAKVASPIPGTRADRIQVRELATVGGRAEVCHSPGFPSESCCPQETARIEMACGEFFRKKLRRSSRAEERNGKEIFQFSWREVLCLDRAGLIV